jgi:hypothetical protein
LGIINETDRALEGPLHTVYKPAPSSSKPLYAPPGVPRQLFIDVVRAACLIHRVTGGDRSNSEWLDPKAIKTYLPTRVPIATVEKITRSTNFQQALILRGVTSPADGILTGEQLRGLAALSDVTTHLSLESRLKRADIPKYKWDAWMNNTVFRAAHDKIAHDIFVAAQSSIDTQVVSGALSGKLEFIKYYNEITGRYSPGRRAHADVQSILNDIIEIVTRNVKDPKALQAISAELSASVAKLG